MSVPPAPAAWRLPGSTRLGIAGVTCLKVATALHLTALPLAILHNFGGTLRGVGLIASVAAGLEVPCMLAWGWAASRMSKELILVVNGLLYALYLILLSRAHSVGDVLWLQGLNAVATAALLSITISYLQGAIAGRVGLSTSLMDLTNVVSAFVAASAFAALAGSGRYTAVFVGAAVVSVIGAGLLGFSRDRTPRKGDGVALPDRII